MREFNTSKIVWGSILYLSGNVSVIHAHVKSCRKSNYWRLACKDYRHDPKDALKGTRKDLCARCCAALQKAGQSEVKIWQTAAKAF